MKTILLIRFILLIISIILVLLFNFFYVKKHQKIKDFLRKTNGFYIIPTFILLFVSDLFSNILISYILFFTVWTIVSFQWLGIYYDSKYRKELKLKKLSEVDEKIKELFINKSN